MLANLYQELGITHLLTYEVLQNFEDSPGFVPMEVEEQPFILESPLREREPSLQLVGQQTEPAASQTEPAASQTEPAASQTVQQPQQSAPRRRRRRRQQITEIDDQNTALRSATETLASIETVSAQATNRLAAAIEALAARLNEPIRIVLEDSRTSQMVNQMLILFTKA
ncbi:hypothetical protein PYW08_010401 [Mythimna loreyi]|uniref:Uncharacterized protein n=1 Tax=Mythimna loreyi TaxID=667449 RepID=A0ACC2Q4D2_9NEOP|nr:hypothetical protein PYW08_010401 [Mythimna loreyi]